MVSNYNLARDPFVYSAIIITSSRAGDDQGPTELTDRPPVVCHQQKARLETFSRGFRIMEISCDF